MNTPVATAQPGSSVFGAPCGRRTIWMAPTPSSPLARSCTTTVPRPRRLRACARLGGCAGHRQCASACPVLDLAIGHRSAQAPAPPAAQVPPPPPPHGGCGSPPPSLTAAAAPRCSPGAPGPSPPPATDRARLPGAPGPSQAPGPPSPGRTARQCGNFASPPKGHEHTFVRQV